MTGDTLQQKVVVTNPQGFHMRPAAAFASLAKSFRSAVHVVKDDQRVDGKSVLELMCLAALPGSELTIEVSGDDAPDALARLVEVVNAVVEDPENGAPPAGSNGQR